MWLFNSSIGRKVVMSVTGIALILFLTFHMCMNLVALFSGDAYNMICEFLGANWYALVATAGLAGLAVLHIVYAFFLYAQNRKARGDNRYEVTARNSKVEWASQHMLALGIIVVLGLLLHLFNFWYNMMFAELWHEPWLGGLYATDGYGYIMQTFFRLLFQAHIGLALQLQSIAPRRHGSHEHILAYQFTTGIQYLPLHLLHVEGIQPYAQGIARIVDLCH